MLAKVKQQIRAQWRRGLLGSGLVAAIGIAIWSARFFSSTDQMTSLEKFGYDFACALQSSRQVSDVQIIEMDQRSFKARGQPTAGLWDRNLHAELLRNLARDGARVVVFDVLFDTVTQTDKDQ